MAGREQSRHALWGVLAVLYAAFIFVLSDTPGDTLSAVGIPGWLLNLAHAPLYAGLTSLVLLALAGRMSAVRNSPWPSLWTFGAVATYALTDEFHQRFVPGRSAALGDLALDIMGTIIALALLRLYARRMTGVRAATRMNMAGAARTDLMLALGAAAFALLLFLPSRQNDFTNWDDYDYVVNNADIQGFSVEHFQAWWTHRVQANLAPVTMASLTLDYTLWKLNPFGYHLTNILLHVLGGALIVWLFLELRAPPVAAGIGALLFIAHPAQVESVAWVAERKSLLALVFMLLSFIVYIRATRSPAVKPWGLAASFLLFLVALLSKISVVVLPGVLFLYDLGYRREQPLWKLVLEKIPFGLAAVFFALLTAYFQSQIGILKPEWLGGTPLLHGATMASYFGRYARILLFPTGLSALYNPPAAVTGWEPWSIAGYAFLGLGLAGMLWALTRRRTALWWMGIFWLGFLPVAQIVPFWIRMADRYLQIPLIGWSAGAGLGAAALLKRLRTPGRQTAFLMILGLVFVSYASLTLDRQKVWKDSLTLWGTALDRPPVHWRIGLNYARALHSAGEFQASVPYYEQALAVDPDFFLTLKLMADVTGTLGDMGRAEALYRRAMSRIDVHPTQRAEAGLGLGLVLERQGRTKKAVEIYLAALALYPSHAPGQVILGRAFRSLGRSEEARARLELALKLDPEITQAEILLASLDTDSDRFEQSRARLDRVIASEAFREEALYEKARLSAAQGDFDGAREQLNALLGGIPPGPQRQRILAAEAALNRGEIPTPAFDLQAPEPDAR